MKNFIKQPTKYKEIIIKIIALIPNVSFYGTIIKKKIFKTKSI